MPLCGPTAGLRIILLLRFSTEQATKENGGIVFDGSAGTVYGSVTLQDDLTIGAGETLTIGGWGQPHRAGWKDFDQQRHRYGGGRGYPDQ